MRTFRFARRDLFSITPVIEPGLFVEARSK
jgi:hypothetical protein